MKPSSPSRKSEPPAPVRSWLAAKVYEPKRRRTVDLVRSAVDALRLEGQRVSLSTVAHRSRVIDPEGRGISESAILHNPEARAYFDEHRTRRARVRRVAASSAATLSGPARISPDRDPHAARQRYFRMPKPDLVERLLAVEQAFARERTQRSVEDGERLADPDLLTRDATGRLLRKAEQRTSRLEQLYAQAEEEIRCLRAGNARLALQIQLLEDGRAPV